MSRIEEKLQLARDQLGIYRTASYLDRVKKLEADLEKEMIRIDTSMAHPPSSLDRGGFHQHHDQGHHHIQDQGHHIYGPASPAAAHPHTGLITPSRAAGGAGGGGGSYASGLMGMASPRLMAHGATPRLPLIQVSVREGEKKGSLSHQPLLPSRPYDTSPFPLSLSSGV